ncbi:MAG: ATP-binding cassette domain-containing protein [Rhodospirillales bacterium]|nr:ATP-binding cassette domain-containing protein [Rhodospirillales bacterium]
MSQEEQALFSDSFSWVGQRLPMLVKANRKLSRRKMSEISSIKGSVSPEREVYTAPVKLFDALGYVASSWTSTAREKQLPLVAAVPGYGYWVVYDLDNRGAWLVEGPAGRDAVDQWPEGTKFIPVASRIVEHAPVSASHDIDRAITSQRSWIFFFVLASVVATILMLATSLFSMQVYDRVIATGGLPTLVVLMTGVLGAIFVEFLLKVARASIVRHMTKDVDVACGRHVFSRLLSVRLDAFPQAVGTLAAQVRGFEAVRNYRTAKTTYMLSDAPIALIFLAVIFLLAGPLLAAIPLAACVIAILCGFSFRKAIERHTQKENLVGNKRQGNLVEVIRNIEILKSTGSDWFFKQKWQSLSEQTVDETIETKKLSELSTFIAGAIQQISYVLLVSAGAYLAMSDGGITIGAIIACSILSGRILTPINMIPGLLVQSAHSKAALQNLDALYRLPVENQTVDNPLVPEIIQPDFKFDRVEFSYAGQQSSLSFDKFHIYEGQKVGVVGAVGCGKSTLLKLLSGECAPSHGHLLVGGIDIQHIDPGRRVELISYLPQQTRLFGGTLRDNLTLGLPHVEDQKLLEAAEKTGLMQVISGRHEGLDTPIHEGGSGLSGGQAQLVAVTRSILSDAKVWLLDEPSASLDETFEAKCIAALAGRIGAEDTLVLVTHKAALLSLIDRLIVLGSDGQIVMDGPKSAVLQKLNPPQTKRSTYRNKKTGATAVAVDPVADSAE